MRLKTSYVAVCAFFVLLASRLPARLCGQSLGDIARQERERKKSQTAQGPRTGTAVANEIVGVRLVVPQSWKPRELLDPENPHLLIDCLPERPNTCWLMVKSSSLPKEKAAITEADRNLWDTGKHPRYPIPTRLVASRNLAVAAYQAYEVIVQNQNPPHERTRTVYVLARDVGRLFEFSFSAAWDSQDRYNDYARAVETVLQSFSPMGRAADELTERAIPGSLKRGTRKPANVSPE